MPPFTSNTIRVWLQRSNSGKLIKLRHRRKSLRKIVIHDSARLSRLDSFSMNLKWLSSLEALESEKWKRKLENAHKLNSPPARKLFPTERRRIVREAEINRFPYGLGLILWLFYWPQRRSSPWIWFHRPTQKAGRVERNNWLFHFLPS